MGKERALGLGQNPVHSSFLWDVMLILTEMCNAEVKMQRGRAEEGIEEGLSLTEAKTGPQRRTCTQ